LLQHRFSAYFHLRFWNFQKKGAADGRARGLDTAASALQA